MPLKDQQPVDSNELLADINYLNQANKNEIDLITNGIRQRIDAVSNSGDAVELIIDEIAKELGQLKASVKLTEKVIHSIQQQQGRKFGSGPVRGRITNPASGLRFCASQLAGNKNLFPVESVDGGDNFCWSGSDPEIDFSFTLDRHELLEMQIHLICLIKPTYSRRMKIFIDGQHIKHWFAPLGPKMIVGCKLPCADKETQTDIKVVLPGTHSPSEISDSPDFRKLGIAISEICFDKPVGILTRFQMRLRIKK